MSLRKFDQKLFKLYIYDKLILDGLPRDQPPG